MTGNRTPKKRTKMFKIETERLILRPLTQNDWKDTFEHRSDIENSKYIYYMTEEEIRKIFDERIQPWSREENKWLSLGVELKENKKLIGEVGFRYLDKKSALGEFGYRFNRNYHNKGYATEASKALVNKIFKELKIHKLVAICDAENVPSYKIMEKLGMKKEAHYKEHSWRRGKWCDEFVYSLINNDHDLIISNK